MSSSDAQEAQDADEAQETDDDEAHVVVVNRWRERYAHYERYLDHRRHRVTYVTTEVGRDPMPADAVGAKVVAATDDVAAVRASVAALADRHGPPTAIVALKEDDLLVGAVLREEWGCPGPRVAELQPFRDKSLMCTLVRRAGLPVPEFAPAPDAAAVRAFAAEHGWPVVVKPYVGSSSAGVARLDGPDDLADLDLGGGPYLVQAFCADPIHHVDGVFDGRRVLVCRSSRYLNDCLGFRSGSVLGSVEVDDPVVAGALQRAAEGFLGALTDRPTVFHLEAFVGQDGTGEPRCTFLEVGARTGGAEIAFLWRDVHGYDLMEVGTRLQLGQAPPPPPRPRPGGDPVAGWLLVPAPAERPCRITSVSDVSRADGTGPYAQVVLQPGQVLPDADSYYEHVGGRFRFRGRSTAEVEAAIRTVARDYRVEATPLIPTLERV